MLEHTRGPTPRSAIADPTLPHPERESERGIALVITLLIVALLSILVVEFTESVQVDTHLSRNSLNALQATYLARSGINVLAAALVEDETPNVDPAEEDGWRSFVLQGCSTLPALELPAGWRMCVRIVDESGKININLTQPRVLDPERMQTECVAGNEVCWREALGRLVEGYGLDGQAVADAIGEYWLTTVTNPETGEEQTAPFFSSVEDIAGVFPIFRDRTSFEALRRYVTAVRLRNKVVKTPVNICTAPVEVLRAILDDDALAEEIVTRRLDQPCTGNVGDWLSGAGGAVGLNQFGTRSSLFRLEAAAIVNGIGKTVRALVFRQCGRGAVQGQTPCTLEYLDWQKEGGAELFRDAEPVDVDLDDALHSAKVS